LFQLRQPQHGEGERLFTILNQWTGYSQCVSAAFATANPSASMKRVETHRSVGRQPAVKHAAFAGSTPMICKCGFSACSTVCDSQQTAASHWHKDRLASGTCSIFQGQRPLTRDHVKIIEW
jgi:hypothetical protein